MAWIELHDTLPDHKKVVDLSGQLNMDKDLIVGKLVRLWTWAITNRESGLFSERDVQTIAEVMRFKGNPQRLINALVFAGLMDKTEKGYIIHDWDEHVEMLLAKRELRRSQARDRKRKQREKERDNNDRHMNVTRDNRDSHAVTVPYRTLDMSNDISSPHSPPAGDDVRDEPAASISKPTLTKAQEARFGRFWNVYPRKESKEAARKAWKKLNPDDELTDAIIAAVCRAKDKDTRFREVQFTPHPATWLNAQGWTDELTTAKPRAALPKSVRAPDNQRKYSAEELERIGVDLLNYSRSG